MNESFYKQLEQTLDDIKAQGLYKKERLIKTPQKAHIQLADGQQVINLCANNYLGLSNHPALLEAAHQALTDYGYGLSSVRFICGTQTLHKTLEQEISTFLQTEDTILYSSCFDANTGLFETLLTDQDAIISDALNHASVIDGIRLCKAKRYVYANNDMQQLEEKLKEAEAQRFRIIATDGVFSMDGTIANLQAIVTLAERYNALVMVDDSHAVGFLGENGRGSIEYRDVLGKVDIITGTLGKALGGASGGYTSGRREIIDLLRQRSRPYLFSNSLAPVIAATSIRALQLIQENKQLLTTLKENTLYFREKMTLLGFNLVPGEHPIIPVMLGDAVLATRMADNLLKLGIYVIGFSFPVVPKGQARIRTQMSAGLNREDLDRAINAFATVGRELGVIQ